MVTFDEMRRDQVALKQQVEKLNETVEARIDEVNNRVTNLFETSSTVIDGKRVVDVTSMAEIEGRLSLIEKDLDFQYDYEPGYELGGKSKRLEQFQDKIALLKENSDFMFDEIWSPIQIQIPGIKFDDKYGNVILPDWLVSGWYASKTKEYWNVNKIISEFDDYDKMIDSISLEVDGCSKHIDKLDQNNVDLLKKFNTFKDETGKTLKAHADATSNLEGSFDNLWATVKKLTKLVEDNNKAEQSYLKGIEAKNQELTKQNKLLTIEVNDMEKRLNNLTDRLIKLEGTAVRSPVVEQPVKEEEWLTATECAAAIKEKFPALKDLKVEEFSNSMAWSRYVSEREGNSHNRKVMPIGVKLNAVRNDRKGNVEYNPAFIEKFADRVLKHRKASSEFQCKGVEE